MKYTIPFSPPDISQAEIEAVVDTLQSGWITTGPKTKLLEKKLSEYVGTQKTVCLNSATAAMELVLRVLGVGPGDEVIVPAMTYTASCSVIEHVGATPVMVDLQPTGFEMDYDAVVAAITERTKVIIPVDIAGIPCDYERLRKIVTEKQTLFHANANNRWQQFYQRVVIMADSAHAFGSRYKGQTIGNVADFTTFSFHAVKNLTTAEGGSVTWRDVEGLDHEALYRTFQIYSLHGQTKDALSKTQLGAWEYDIELPGYKCNMTDIMAAIGLVQLERYDDLMQRRHQIVQRYHDGFVGTRIQPLAHVGKDFKSCCHLYITHIEGATDEQRRSIIQAMAEQGIACNVHFKPLPLLTAYQQMGYKMEDYPRAFNYYANEITLPLHTRLSDEEVDYIIATYSKIVAQIVGV